MSETKFTAGPWLISWNSLDGGTTHGIYAKGELDRKGWEIARVNYLPTMDSHVTEETGKANAKLIAASPDLLNACIEVLRCLANADDRPYERELLQRVIDKATL